jgi:hypothetical protein
VPNSRSWLHTVRKTLGAIGGFVVLPAILGALIGDSPTTLGLLIGIGGPLILFIFMVVFAAEDLFMEGGKRFWAGVWILFAYFTSMFIVWYYSTDQVFLLDFGQKVIKMFTR